MNDHRASYRNEAIFIISTEENHVVIPIQVYYELIVCVETQFLLHAYWVFALFDIFVRRWINTVAGNVATLPLTR